MTETLQKKEVKGMFEGPLLPLIIKLSLPILAGMFFQLLLNIVDTLFVSRIDIQDPSIVGGVGVVFPIMFIFIAIASGVQVGVSSLVARSVGKRDQNVLDTIVSTSFLSALALGIIFTVVGACITSPFVGFLTKGKSVGFYTNGVEYLYWLLPGLIPALLAQVFIGIFQGVGHPKYVMVAVIAGVIVNIVCDPLFIYTFKMGVAGAAIATALSGIVTLLILVVLFFMGKSGVSRHISFKKFKMSTLGGILVIGFPMFLAQGTMSVSMMFYNKVLIHLDEIAMSAYTFVGRIDQAFIMPCMAISAALVTVVGQNYGRGNIDRTRKAWRVGVATAATIVFVIAGLHILFSRPIYQFMTGGNEQIVDYAVLQVSIMELSSVCAAVGICGRGVFQGLGRPFPSVILTLIRTLGFGILFTLLFVFGFGWGVKGVYWGNVVGNVLTCLITPFWVEGVISHIKKKKIVQVNKDELKEVTND